MFGGQGPGSEESRSSDRGQAGNDVRKKGKVGEKTQKEDREKLVAGETIKRGKNPKKDSRLGGAERQGEGEKPAQKNHGVEKEAIRKEKKGLIGTRIKPETWSHTEGGEVGVSGQT